MDQLQVAATHIDYIAGALALLLHYIFKGVLDDGTFLNSINKNKKYIITSALTTAIGFLGVDTLTTTLGFYEPFTFCVTWGAGAGSIFYNVFKLQDNMAEKKLTKTAQ